MLRRVAVAACLGAFGSACFSPNVQEGLACDDGKCPPGQTCDEGICRSTAPGDDAAPVIDAAGGPDAAVADGGAIDAGAIDAGAIDAAVIDATPACMWTRPPLHFDPCDLPDPIAMNLSMAGTYTYNTDTGVLTAPDAGTSTPPSAVLSLMGQSTRVLSAIDFSLANVSTLRPNGSRPLIIAASATITINGAINVNSNSAGNGAGANPSMCTTANPGQNGSDGGGGGGGGGFRGIGGEGGMGDTAGQGFGGGSIPLPDHLRGGCLAAPGGDGGGSAMPGTAGPGGGAAELASAGGITIGGVVHAGGRGGGGGMSGSGSGGGGGGGGGSGGMIYLDAPSVTLQSGAVLAANGGAGGEGAGQLNNGSNGQDGQPSSAAAIRGMGMSGTGGDGSNGSAGAMLSPAMAEDAGANAGGGGGGGGAGYIVIRTDSSNLAGATISPPHLTQ